MIAAHRRRIEKTDREKIFVIANAADFPKDSPVASVSAEIDAKIADFLAQEKKLAARCSAKFQSLEELKGDTRDFLIDRLQEITLGAAAVGEEAVPGITAKYNLPGAQNLSELAEAWAAATEPHEALFVKAGLDANFRTNLINARNDFQCALDETAATTDASAEAFERLEMMMQDIMKLGRRRSAMVELKYKHNPGKLASWIIASHLEPPPRRKLNIIRQMG